MSKPLISIITPTYNSAELIEKTYQSIRNQTYSHWEWVVTDDCSSDDTIKILESIKSQDDRVKIFRNIQNSGAAHTRNNSIEKSSGEYIAFIDSDDLWQPEKLMRQIEFMAEKDIHFSFTAYELIDEQEASLNQIVDSKQMHPLSYQDMLRKKATLGCSTVMLKKAAFPGLSMPLLRTGQDYALWLKILKSGEKAYPLNHVLTKYRIMPNSISRNKVKKAKRQWQIYREIEKLNLVTSIECFLYYAYRAVFRQ